MSKLVVIEGKKYKRRREMGLDSLSDIESQASVVNQLFLGQPFEGDGQAGRELRRKLAGYKSQDTRKGRSLEKFIDENSLLEKLVLSKMKCSYCMIPLLFIYRNIREERQWTLDRIDNALAHTSQNTVIACLKCNLQKRNRDHKKFRFSKQMRLIKKY